MLGQTTKNRMLVLVAAVACFNLFTQSAAACDHTKLLSLMKGARERAGATSGNSRPTMQGMPVPTASAELQAGTSRIVGLWQVSDYYQGQLVDQYFDTWHADGNELFIDGTNPAEDNVCQGIWTAATPNTYKLKHMAWYFDDGGNLLGYVVFHDVIQMGTDNNSFTGTEDIFVYDLNGNLIGEYDGDNLQATRISVDF